MSTRGILKRVLACFVALQFFPLLFFIPLYTAKGAVCAYLAGWSLNIMALTIYGVVHLVFWAFKKEKIK